MIDLIIVKYLSSNKRLVIPGLGTFIRKDGGEIVFVEFMKKDDGVLTSLVADRKESTANAALAEVARYVADVKQAVDTKGEYLITSFGRIYKTPEGTLEFDRKTGATYNDPAIPSSSGKSGAPTEAPANNPIQQSTKEITPLKAPQRANTPYSTSAPASQPGAPEKSQRAERVAADKLFGTPSGTNKDIPATPTPLAGQHRPNNAPSTGHNAPAQRQQTVSSPRSGAPGSVSDTDRGQNPQSRATRPRPVAPSPKRKKADMVMIIAIAAALIAIVALGFSMAVNNGPAKNFKTTKYLEEKAPESNSTPDDGVITSIE